MNYKGTYIIFVEVEPKKKTRVWSIESSQSITESLGWVMWYAPWRKYCFYPGTSTVFEEICLKEIADFCYQRTKDHRTLRRIRA